MVMEGKFGLPLVANIEGFNSHLEVQPDPVSSIRGGGRSKLGGQVESSARLISFSRGHPVGTPPPVPTPF